MEIDELWESSRTDPFGIEKIVNKYLIWLELGREKIMDANEIENARTYVTSLQMHSTGIKDCIAIGGLLENKPIAKRTTGEKDLLNNVQRYRGQATEELTQWAYNDLGIIAFEREMYTAARTIFKIATKLAGHNNQALNYNAGLACQKSRDPAGFAEAILYYRKALEKSRLPAVLNNLGVLQIEMNNMDGKTRLLDALKLCPEDPDILLNLGLFSKMHGSSRDAILYLEKLQAIMPERPEIKYFLAKEYQKTKNSSNARKYMLEFIAEAMKK